jgi:hypothetical protein
MTNIGTREIYKITDMSTQSVHKENNEAVVYKSVDDKNNHIIMTERKFSVKSQDKLKVEIDNENTTVFDLHFNMYIVKMTHINNKLIIHIVNMLIKRV